MRKLVSATLLPALLITLAPPALADQHKKEPGIARPPASTMRPGLMIPDMDATRGRQLFAGKGCVVCHSINGVGGKDARPFDAATMTLPMNAFEFTARMWRGAEPMIALQREELGGQIELTGQELADIIAFVHDADEQKKFSENDIPHKIKDAMTKDHGKEKKHEKE